MNDVISCDAKSLFKRYVKDDIMVFLSKPEVVPELLYELPGGSVALFADKFNHLVAIAAKDGSYLPPSASNKDTPILLTYEAESDMGYLYLGEKAELKISSTISLDYFHGINLDYSADDRLIGIEFYSAFDVFCPAILLDTVAHEAY